MNFRDTLLFINLGGLFYAMCGPGGNLPLFNGLAGLF